ncbi:Cysteine desulfurase [Zostera marina]|uniref:Cysteine desulfurase n=1 Tax=Zostera marina TaxID=29655 RepID=A0A0K9Q0T4_ZOSMR|nr:Cysteine desulfurase [Zostera marina]
MDSISLVDQFNLFSDQPISDSDAKINWLRSQIIGSDAEFDSPFGRRKIMYCDFTASGRFLTVIEDYLRAHVLPFYGNTHTGDSYVGFQTSQMVQQASKYVKECMGAGSNDVLFFCGSGCTASIKRLQEVMGITVPSILRSTVLSYLSESERWVVYVGPYEHHSNLLSWRQSLADVVEITLDDSGNIDIDALEMSLKDPVYAGRPKLGSFSACSNVTGILTDTRAIARVLHENDAFACFDFACSAPYVDIQMRSGRSDGYDAIFLSPHKFLGGPGSSGMLLMSDDLYRLKGSPPSTSGGGTVDYVAFNDEDTLYCEDLEEREDAGTPAIMQKIRAALAFRVKEYIGHDLIRHREAYISKKIMEKLSGNDKIFVLGNLVEERQPIVSFVIYPEGARRGKHLHCRFVTILLNDLFGIQARGGCACAAPYAHALLGISSDRSQLFRSSILLGYEGVKPGFTRVSIGYCSSEEETDFVLDAVDFVARYGERFLSLYRFNWKTGDWHYTDDHCNKTIGITARRNQSSNGSYETCDEYMSLVMSLLDILPVSHAMDPVPADVEPETVTFMT